MDFKQFFNESENYLNFYNAINQQLNNVQFLWRSGNIPGGDGWEFGAGGTFFAFDHDNAKMYGKPNQYRLIKKPSFILEALSDDEETVIDLKGNPIPPPQNFSSYLMSNNCHSIITINPDDLNIKYCIIWMLNQYLNEYLEGIQENF